MLARALFRWNWDINLHDLDGSLTGYPNSSAVSAENITLGDSNCHKNSAFDNGVSCEKTDWIRFAYNGLDPNLVLFANITKTIDKQMVTAPKRAKRLTHPNGFMYGLEANQRYTMEFDMAAFPTNVSFEGGFWNFKPGQYIIMQLVMHKKPDVVDFNNQYPVNSLVAAESLTPLTPSSPYGSWYWENSTLTLSFIVGNNKTLPFLDIQISFTAYVCRFLNCQPPISPALLLPITARPANALFWSNLSTWNTISLNGGYVYLQNGVVRAPLDGENVRIPQGYYVVVDTDLPKIKHLEIEGYLEFDNGRSHHLACDILLIDGGQLIIGWENDPILTEVTLSITGNKTNALAYMLADDSTTIGFKSMGVFGGLDIHGKPRNVSWTTLNATVFAGSNQIVLEKAVDWQVNEQIVITTTSYVATETEIMTIQAVSSDRRTLTLNGSLLYNHLSFIETLTTGKTVRIAAGVGLLTRNVKIIGAEYDGQEGDLYGMTMLVSDYSNKNSDGILMYYKGYARLSDVEFVHPGQYFRGTGEESTFGIVISNLGTYNYSRPTYVRSCSFHHGYTAAIGILGSDSIPIENNVFYR